ncbi:MAG: dipicolinate synthase subunit [Firmicutes bacterium]|nr:dipicolinate synthase subunit [Bacillota bacterium]
MRDDIQVGFAVCGSFCTHRQVLDALTELRELYKNILPIASDFSAKTNTRFGRAEDLIWEMERITGRNVISNIQGAEPIGPQKLLDILVIAPCTGNTLAKLATGVADTSVTMAAKAHLRNGRPVVVAISTNDGLGTAAKNIGELLNRKNYYFVPFRQDDPNGKPTSVVADLRQLPETIAAALEGRQLQPLLLGPEAR